jgi:hypothetical protein
VLIKVAHLDDLLTHDLIHCQRRIEEIDRAATTWRYVTETVALLAAGPRSCDRRCGTPARPGTPTWSSTAP